MSNEVLTRNEVARATPTEIRPQELLDRVVETIRRDSRQEAEAFLAETTVPHGGE